MTTDDLERITRWVDAGAVWAVAALRGDSATVSLLRCDGGEEVERFVTTDPRVRALCRERW